MAEEISTSETVVKKSSGNVKITVEEYNSLKEAASQPQTVVVNSIEKTPKMAADDKVWTGGLLMGGGAGMFVIGLIQFVSGKKALKAL